jgi:4-hydroxy-3-methylbut-2-enyl diphosphate reductase
MKSFNVPVHYRSPLVTAIKQKRKAADKMKRDFAPTILEVGSLQIILARHFGFCYGVENAIEIAFRAVDENPGKRIFLLSEMIHNPGVNADLQAQGVKFLMDTKGNKLPAWDSLTADDIVVIPAFGTTVELEEQLKAIGINPTRYETTCPFVEKVWNRAEQIGGKQYTVIVHGKPSHEETRATFSHSKEHTPTVVVKDMSEAQHLGKFITGELPADRFYEDFEGQYSEGFDVTKDLQRIGVVNQTTMLATETQAIADYLRDVIVGHYKPENISDRFADTRDTLCYATNDNQTAVRGMLEAHADIAIIIGGYNSSNTSHLAELCETKLPTYYIKDEHCLVSANEVHHFNMHAHKEETTVDYLPAHNPLRIMVTSGASCPDALVERVIERLARITGNTEAFDALREQWQPETATGA